MRVLVEQTKSEVRSALERLATSLGTERTPTAARLGVHLLMGGADAGQWHLYPERDAVLIGTQDMLLSRAMNRGYASPRARWPMEFGLLSQDALWVMDEVQLMGRGACYVRAASGVPQPGTEKRKSGFGPVSQWWMSATLQRSWLEKSPEMEVLGEALGQNIHEIEPAAPNGANVG